MLLDTAMRTALCIGNYYNLFQRHWYLNRDLKLENILINRNSAGILSIKLIDFGLAEYYEEDQILNDPCGKLFYRAPEVILKHYNNKCDLWSIGIITFSLLYGRFPFDGFDEQEIVNKILWTKLKFSSQEKVVTSKKARSFIRKLLKKDFTERFNVQ